MLLILTVTAFPLLAIVAYLAGSALIPRSQFESWCEAVAVRVAAGIVALTTVLFLLGVAGLLGPLWVTTLMAVLVGARALSHKRIETPRISREETGLLLLLAIAFIPLSMLAAYPPTEFDETLYHLPAVKRFALTGRLPFIPELRMPVFAHFQEVLEVPLYHWGGGAATHAASLLAAALTAMLLFDFTRRTANAVSGFLAAALFLGLPLAVHLATSGNVDMLLACLVVAALFCAERCRRAEDLHWPILAGVFAGAASSVKYLGLFWLVATVVLVFAATVTSNRWRNTLVTIISGLVVLTPWYTRLFIHTGNPLFPFLPSIFGATDWTMEMPPHQSLLGHTRSMLRAPLDAIFDRKTIGIQPPLTPWFLLTIPLAVLRRDSVTRIALLLSLLWLGIWTWLPRDVRYLLPAIAIVCAVGAPAVIAEFEPLQRRRNHVAAAVIIGIVFLTGSAYTLWRIQRYTGVPRNAAEADDYLRRRVPAITGITRLNAVAQPDERALLCGGEELLFHFGIPVVGDFTGPGRYDRFAEAQTAGELARAMERLTVQYLVVVKTRNPGCSLYPRESPVFTIIYEDSYVRIARLKGDTGTR